MKRLLKSWVFWAFAALGPLLALAAMIRHGMTNECCACGSHRAVRVAVLKFGGFRSPALLTWSESEGPSPAFLEILSGTHDHQWFILGGWSARLGGRAEEDFSDWLATGVVMSMPNQIHIYNRDPQFRTFLSGKVQRGETTREDVARILTLPDAADGDVAARRDAWWAEFERRK